MSKNEKNIISFTLSKDIITKVKQKAKEQERSVSSMVEMILKGKEKL